MKKIIIILAAALSFTSCKKDKDAPRPSQPSSQPSNQGGDNNNGNGNNGGNNNGGVVIPELQLTNTAAVNNPCGVAVSKSGMIAVTEYNGFIAYGKKGTTRVWKSYSDMAANQAPYASWQNTGAEAAVFDENENLYIAETEQTAAVVIYKRTANGFSLAKTIQGGLNNPRGMAIKDGALYLADDGNNRVLRYDNPLTSSNYTPVLTHLQAPKAVAIDGNSIYVAEYGVNKVSKYTIGDWANPTATVTVTKPVDVAVKDGLMVVGQPEAGTIQQYSSETLSNTNVKQTAIGGNVFGLAFAADGTKSLYVADFDNGKVSSFQVK